MNAHTLEITGSFLGKTWGVVGPLVGVVIGAWLSRSWQRKQWVLDSKKAEYRELIGALSRSIHIMARHQLYAGGMVSDEEKKECFDAYLAGVKSIEDRIFVDKKVRAAKIGEHWEKIDLGGSEMIWKDWNEIHDALVKLAHDDLGIKD